MQAGRSKGSRTAWGHMPLAVLSHAGKYLHIYFSAAGRQLAEPAGGRAPFRYSRSRRDYAEACTLNLKDRCRCTACSSASRAFGLQGFVQIALKFGRRSRFSRNVGLWDLSLRYNTKIRFESQASSDSLAVGVHEVLCETADT